MLTGAQKFDLSGMCGPMRLTGAQSIKDCLSCWWVGERLIFEGKAEVSEFARETWSFAISQGKPSRDKHIGMSAFGAPKWGTPIILTGRETARSLLSILLYGVKITCVDHC